MCTAYAGNLDPRLVAHRGLARDTAVLRAQAGGLQGALPLAGAQPPGGDGGVGTPRGDAASHTGGTGSASSLFTDIPVLFSQVVVSALCVPRAVASFSFWSLPGLERTFDGPIRCSTTCYTQQELQLAKMLCQRISSSKVGC